MALVAEFTIPSDALPGGEALAELPEVTLELERIVPTQEAALPFFWVWGDETDEFVERLRRAPEIADVDELERVEGGALVRATWTPDAEIVRAIQRLDATVMEAVGTADEWTFQLRADDRDRFTAFQEIFEAHDISIRLDRLYSFGDLVEDDRGATTPKQRETLLRAYHEGYFDEPRQITQEELGELLGVSGRAVARRLRRGTRSLVAATLSTSPRESDL